MSQGRLKIGMRWVNYMENIDNYLHLLMALKESDFDNKGLDL